jgi:crotonobetainyl-CoA:carnitine CoA-transferase CaiB-like acyl-CoA transferase
MADRLRAARIAYGRVSEMEDLVTHPQNRHVTVETPSGPVQMLAPGAQMDGCDATLGAVPALGAHTDTLRQEFGDD